MLVAQAPYGTPRPPMVSTSSSSAVQHAPRPSSAQAQYGAPLPAPPMLPRSRSASPSLRPAGMSPSLPHSSSLPSVRAPLVAPFPSQSASSSAAGRHFAPVQLAQPQHTPAQQPTAGYHPYRRQRAPSAPSGVLMRDPTRPFGLADVDQAYDSLDNRRRTASLHGPTGGAPLMMPPSAAPRPAREAPPSPSRSRTQSSESVPRARTQSSSASTISVPRATSERSITPTQQAPLPSSASAGSLRAPTAPAPSNGLSRTPSPLARPVESPAQPSPAKAPKGGFAKFKRAFASKDAVAVSSAAPLATSVTSLSSSSTSQASSSPPATPPNQPMQSSSNPARHRLGIFSSSKMNSSTDNLSIQSTMSSASVMLRKIGSFGGKLGKRSSLAGLFKGKDGAVDPLRSDAVSEFGVASSAKMSKKERKAAKSSLVAASVAPVHAEVDRGANMSSAAAFARHHQLQYAERERAAQTSAAPPPRLPSTSSFPDSLSRIRQPASGLGKPRSKLAPSLPVGDFGELDLQSSVLALQGARPDSEDDDDGDSLDEFGTDENETIGEEGPTPRQSMTLSPFDDDAASFRGMGPATTCIEDPSAIEYDGSVFRAKALAARRLPSGEVRQVKSILKTRSEPVPLPRAPFHSSRIRSDSYDPTSPTASGSGGGSDPPAMVEAIMASPSQVDGVGGGAHHSGRPFSPYEQPSYNASAPSLVTRHIPSSPHRSVTAPPTERRRIAFAPSLSVHTTWPGDVYNRASEPATCNRLNAELAAAIKAELNSFKMSEMAVHPESRIFTHFFV